MTPFGRKEAEKTLAEPSISSNIAGAFPKFTFFTGVNLGTSKLLFFF